MPLDTAAVDARISSLIARDRLPGVSVCAVRDRSSSGWADAAPAASSSNKPPIVFFIFLSFSLVYDRAKRSVPPFIGAKLSLNPHSSNTFLVIYFSKKN